MRPTGSRLHLRAAMDAHLASKRRLHSAQIAFRARVIVARFARVPRRSCQARSSPAQPCPVQPCPARPSPARPCPALSSSTLSSSALSSPVGALLFGRWTGSRRPPGSINALLKKIPFWAPIYSPCKPHFIHKIFPRTLSGNYRHPRLAQGKAAVLSSCTQIGEENRGAPHIFRFGFGTSIAHWIRSNLCVASRPWMRPTFTLPTLEIWISEKMKFIDFHTIYSTAVFFSFFFLLWCYIDWNSVIFYWFSDFYWFKSRVKFVLHCNFLR